MSERDDKRRSGDAIGPEEADPLRPPTTDEVLAADRLRAALASAAGGVPADDDLELVTALRAAWSPEALDEGVHAALLDDLPMSEEEVSLAAELREALDGTAKPEIAVALRSAWSPTALASDEHRALVRTATATRSNVLELRPRTRTRQVLVVTTTVAALAASVAVWITTSAPPAEEPLARTRSTEALFGEPFKSGETSARIDRIAVARATDYRDNRFAKWGVR